MNRSQFWEIDPFFKKHITAFGRRKIIFDIGLFAGDMLVPRNLNKIYLNLHEMVDVLWYMWVDILYMDHMGIYCGSGKMVVFERYVFYASGRKGTLMHPQNFKLFSKKNWK